MSEKKVVILTKEQGIILRDQTFATDSYFHPVLSKYMEIMISSEEVDACEKEEFAWLKQLEQQAVQVTENEPDCTKSDLILSDRAVLYRIEDYVSKTVTIAYQCEEGRKEIIEPMTDGASKMGYQLDMETKINSNETKST